MSTELSTRKDINMTKLSLKKVIAIAMAVLLVAAIAVTVIKFYPDKNSVADSDGKKPLGDTSEEPVVFSLQCGFYSSGEKLYLSAEDAVEIRYTKDGGDPRESGKKYKDGITLKDHDDSDCSLYTIKACAVYADGSYSEPVVRSYFVDENIDERFDCLVFAVTIDPDALYNYDDGIFIAGKLRDEWLAETGTPSYDVVPTDPANWNQRGKASERECYVEVYEYDGTCVISQACGMRIFGGWSRANDTKNIRLYARSEYDTDDNRFRYEFFPDALDADGNKITSYNKLSLRTCANDAGYLYMRDDMISAMAHDTVVDAKYSVPCAVFLNGEYYCFAWVQQAFSGDWLDHTYAVEDAEWDIIKGCEYMIWEDDDKDITQSTADWLEMYSYAYKDLTDDETFDNLCEMIDLDNFLTYYAMESYLGNGDWPNNNWKVYRYASGSADEGKYPCDGKWRFMLYDSDFCFGLYSGDAFEQNIANLFDEEYFGLFPEDWTKDVHDDGEKYTRSDLLISLCKRDDVRERFVNILCDIMNWYYSGERVNDYLDSYHTLRLHELVAAANEGKANTWSINSQLLNVREYIKTRPYSAKRQIMKVFSEYTETYKIKAYPTIGVTQHINTANIYPDSEYDFSGEYFVGCEVTVSPTESDGYEFVCWEINGERVYEREVVLSAEKYGENITVKAIVNNIAENITISEVKYKGSSNDYVMLYNPTEEDITLKGYVLSDGDGDFSLPTVTLKAGGSAKVICENYSAKDTKGSIKCDFNLSEKETLSLRDGNGNTLFEMYLPKASKNTVRVYDFTESRWYEKTYETKSRILEAQLPEANWGWGW